MFVDSCQISYQRKHGFFMASINHEVLFGNLLLASVFVYHWSLNRIHVFNARVTVISLRIGKQKLAFEPQFGFLLHRDPPRCGCLQAYIPLQQQKTVLPRVLIHYVHTALNLCDC
jgi:hypothetical protein